MKNKILNIKKTNFEYEIIQSFKAGLVLEGWMVKSIRERKISSAKSVFVTIIKGEAYLEGINITSLKETNSFKDVNETPRIKLLLTKKELNKLIGGQKEDGYTIALQDIFWEKHLVKANIALAKGKNVRDRSKTIKERDLKRDTEREIKNY
jgi:SsrA-binding protein